MKSLILPCLTILGLVGCGYTFRGSGSVLPPDVKRVYIPLVDNESTEVGMSELVTEALRDQFEGYGVVEIVDSESEADAVLRMKITEVTRSTKTSTSRTDTSLELQTKVEVAGELRRIGGTVLWREDELSATRAFGSDRSVVVTSSADFANSTSGSADLSKLSDRELSRGQEQEVLETLAEEVARKVYDQAVAPDF